MGDSIQYENAIVNNKSKITEYSNEHELLLIDWADKAMCFRWLHANSNQKYTILNRWMTIPVIIMSTLTGTANFAHESFPENIKMYAPIMIGSVNILAGILTTIQQFLKVNELQESHRVSSIAWGKFARNLKLELAKKPEERTDPDTLLRKSKDEYDGLMESSPPIDSEVIKLFFYTFSGGKIIAGKDLTPKQSKFLELKKPEICDSIESSKYVRYKKDTASNRLINLKNKVLENEKNKLLDEIVINFEENSGRELNELELSQLQDKIINKSTKKLQNIPLIDK